MASYAMFSMTLDDMEINVNKGLPIILALMVEKGHITNEEADEYIKNYAVILKKPGWWEKTFKYKKDDSFEYHLIKRELGEE